jgi:hypothetical protein
MRALKWHPLDDGWVAKVRAGAYIVAPFADGCVVGHAGRLVGGEYFFNRVLDIVPTLDRAKTLAEDDRLHVA